MKSIYLSQQVCRISLVRFGLVLWHINHYILFNAKSFLNIYIKYIIFTNLSARAGYDTRSMFKRSLAGLNSEFSFS